VTEWVVSVQIGTTLRYPACDPHCLEPETGDFIKGKIYTNAVGSYYMLKQSSKITGTTALKLKKTPVWCNNYNGPYVEKEPKWRFHPD